MIFWIISILEIPENSQNFKNSQKFNRSSDWNNLYMKNYQKNAIFPSVLVSCMKNQLIHAKFEKTHYGIYKRLLWKCIWAFGFKWISNQMITSCISSNSITSTCHVHASYCCIWLCIDCRHRSFSIGPGPETFQSTCQRSSAPCWSTRQANPLVHSDTIPLSRSWSLLLH